MRSITIKIIIILVLTPLRLKKKKKGSKDSHTKQLMIYVDLQNIQNIKNNFVYWAQHTVRMSVYVTIGKSYCISVLLLINYN